MFLVCIKYISDGWLHLEIHPLFLNKDKLFSD